MAFSRSRLIGGSALLAWIALPSLLLAGCAKGPPSSSAAVRVDSSRLQSDRQRLAGTIATVPGYLVAARITGNSVCFKVLVDETLRFAPEQLIEDAGGMAESQDDLRLKLARADSLALATDLAGPVAARGATVIQACKRPPTSSNKKAIEHALEWLDPLKKPERIENAPNIQSLRRELQLFYLERSRRYGWAQLPWEEVVLTGVLLGEDAKFEDEIVGGVDLVPYLVGVHDAQRGRWLILDLTFNDGVARELMLDVLGKQVPGLVKRAGKSTLSF
jgi:hypothetical protein